MQTTTKLGRWFERLDGTRNGRPEKDDSMYRDMEMCCVEIGAPTANEAKVQTMITAWLRQLTQSLGIDYGALLAVVYAALH